MASLALYIILIITILNAMTCHILTCYVLCLYSSGQGTCITNLEVHYKMKRPASWKEPVPTSSDDSSDSDSEDDNLVSKSHSRKSGCSKNLKVDMSEVNVRKKKLGGMNYEALSKHGYHGGPSILKVPPPRVEDKEQNWSWSTGKEGGGSMDSTEESFVERERTRAAALGEELQHVQAKLALDDRDRKKSSFSQKEKRKRDLGQASRGKNYVEEEKRLLRDSGIYSGFDS